MGSFCSTDDSSDKQAGGNTRRPNTRARNTPSETEDSVTYDPSITVDSAVLGAAQSQSRVSGSVGYGGNAGGPSMASGAGVDSNSFKIMVTPPDDAAVDGPDEAEAQYNQIKDDLRKQQHEAEKLVEWKKVADFAAILPKEAKEKLWKGVFKTQEDETMPENKRISKVLRTFVMLHLTRQYKREKKDVPEDIRSKLPAMTKNPSRFIADFIKKSTTTHDESFLSIYNELKSNLENDPKLKQEKREKKLRLVHQNYEELSRQPIGPSFNQIDFLRQAYLQYILYAYQRRIDESS